MFLQKQLAITLISGLFGILCFDAAIAQSSIKLICSQIGVATFEKETTQTSNLIIEQKNGLNPFGEDIYNINLSKKTAFRPNFGDSYKVFSTQQMISLSSVPDKVDSGGRSLISIDRNSGLYARKEWNVDASGKQIAISSLWIGVCSTSENRKF